MTTRRDRNLPSHPRGPYYYYHPQPSGGEIGEHDHDDRYLKLTGGTLSGPLTAPDYFDTGGVRLAGIIASPSPPSGEARDGTLWAYTGTPGGGGGVSAVQVEDGNTPAAVVSLLKFQGDVLSVSGGIATFNLDGRYASLTALAGKADANHNHDGRYLRLVGGTLTGSLTVQGAVVANTVADTSGFDLAHIHVAPSPPSGSAPDGTLWAYTGTPGGGGISGFQVADSSGVARTIDLLRFPDITFGGSTTQPTVSFDGRYRRLSEPVPWSALSSVPVYATRWPTVAEVGALSTTGGTLTGQLTVRVGGATEVIAANLYRDTATDGMVTLHMSAAGLSTRGAAIKAHRAGSGNAHHLSFWTSSSGNTPAERMRISADGSVGIGNTNPNPNYSLDVQGVARFRDGAIGQDGYRLAHIHISINPPSGPAPDGTLWCMV